MGIEHDNLYPVPAFSLGEHGKTEDLKFLLDEHNVAALKLHLRVSHSDLELLKNSEVLGIARDYEISVISLLESGNFLNTWRILI